MQKKEVNGLLDKTQPIPLYYQVKEKILDKINKGVFNVGDIIPSETELQSLYKVSRITIRRAIQELVHEGYLSTQQGRGTYVSQPKVIQDLNLITSWAETMEKLGMHPETKSIKFTQEPAHTPIAKLLEIEAGRPVYRIDRLRYAGGEPLCIMTNYLVPEIVPGLLEKGLIGESLYETLEKGYGIELSRAVEKVEAKAADKDEAALLRVKKGFPLLYVVRTTYDANDTPIEVVTAYNRGDRYAYEVNLLGRPKK